MIPHCSQTAHLPQKRIHLRYSPQANQMAISFFIAGKSLETVHFGSLVWILFCPFFRLRDEGVFLLGAANSYLRAAAEKGVGGDIVVTHFDSVG